MKLQNPYTKGYIEYPIFFNLHNLTYHIQHETPFTERRSEWAVSIIDTGDMVYVPCGENRCRNIYVVTKFYLNKTVQFPKGIYTIPMSYFTTPQTQTQCNH